MKRSLFIILSFTLAISCYSQKRAFTIPDLYRLKNLGEPQLSPDGKKIAFVVTESVLESGKSNSDIYVINSDGSNLRNLTNHVSADNHPRWSSDGKIIRFVSTREDGPQVWQMSAEGGETRKVTNFPAGVGDPEFAPDGSSIIFTSDVYPECGANIKCNSYNDSTVNDGPLKAHMADKLLYRHWTFWKDGKYSHVILFNDQDKNYRDLTPGEYDSPAWDMGSVGFTFSPDGREICFVSNREKHEAETTNKDLWILSVGGGEPKNITDGNDSYDGNPQYSPDGKYIAYKVQTVPNYESDRIRIALYDRNTGERTILTEEFDNWVNDFKWGPDSRTIYFTAQVKGHFPLYKLDIKKRTISLVVDVKTIDAFELSGDGKTLVLIRRSVGEPVEIWSVGTNGKNLKQLTFLNKSVADEVEIRPAEEMWISSPTGKSIHTYLVKPHNFDPTKKYPLILNVHGGPQMQWADAFRGDWQVYPGCGYIVAFPNPHGSTGYGQEFTAAISKDWAGKVYDDIMAVVDSLEKIPYVDKERIGAMGWSYGGYMMMWLEGHTTRFKAIASMMGVYDLKAMHGSTEELWFPEWDLGGVPWESDLYQKWSPNLSVKNFKTPCLVITGERDYRVPYTQSLEFFTDLQRMRIPSELIVFPNDGHWPSGVKSMPLYYNAHLDWFHQYLGGAPAPYDMTKLLRNQALSH
jgi:dipeptidyl aminopeptidase/acylaminoacyl peptidase